MSALNGPEPLLPKIQIVSDRIEKYLWYYFIYNWREKSGEFCDLNVHAAEMLNADILFNIGHTISFERFGDKVFMINAFDDISFDKVALKCANDIKI